MLSFLIFVICMLACMLAFLVWSFWPVLHGRDFTRFERDMEAWERAEAAKHFAGNAAFIAARRNAEY